MTTDRITLPELEQYLAKAADLLRGSIDQADFKACMARLEPMIVMTPTLADPFGSSRRRRCACGAGQRQLHNLEH